MTTSELHIGLRGCIYIAVEAAIATIDDARLLKLYAAKGDPAAFAELVQRYADMVYGTARRVTGSAAAAEDVAQDCFLRLAQRSAAVTGSVAAWLHRTTLNRSLEILRSERARQRREARAASEARIEIDGIETDDAAQLVSRVDEALAALPEDLRVAVTEHFLCARNQADIAASLGLSQSTVSRRIDKGLAKLRQWLHEKGATPAASGALPLLFAQLTKATAPSALRPALVKIGLSGVRGPAVVWPWFIKPAVITMITVSAVVVMSVCGWYMMSPPRDTQIRLTERPAAPSAANPPLAAPAGRFEERRSESEFQGIVPQIPVSSLDAARQFYAKLGFKPRTDDPNLVVTDDDERLQLVVKSPPYVGPVSITILAHGLAKLRQEVIAQKIPIAQSADSPNNAREFTIYDPDQNRIIFQDEELHEPRHP